MLCAAYCSPDFPMFVLRRWHLASGDTEEESLGDNLWDIIAFVRHHEQDAAITGALPHSVLIIQFNSIVF